MSFINYTDCMKEILNVSYVNAIYWGLVELCVGKLIPVENDENSNSRNN